MHKLLRNNRGYSEGFFIGFFIFVYLLTVQYQYWFTMSQNSDIASGKKFKIKDSVYQCQMVQKLEYGDAK